MCHAVSVSDSSNPDHDGPPVLVDRAEGWGTITLNRPHRRNAITGPLASGLAAAVDELGSDPSIAAIVLRGSGGSFCSGVDLTELQRQPQPEWVPDFSEQWRRANIALFNCPCPIVVALERFGINAGAALAFAGDLVVAGQSSFLQVGEIRQGAAIPMNAAWLGLKATPSTAARLAYLGDRVDAEELLRLGLIHQVVLDDAVRSTAEAIATDMASHPVGAGRRIKASLRSQFEIVADEWFQAAGSSALLTARQLTNDK